MKKIFTMILFAAGTISFAAAQSYNHKASGYNDDKKISNNRDIPVAYNKNTDYNKQGSYQSVQTKDNWQNKDQHQSNDLRKDDHDRQADFDRMNKQYDQKINDYRNDRSMSRFDRDRKIREAEQERQEQSRGFGKGLAFGGIAGVLLGAIMNH